MNGFRDLALVFMMDDHLADGIALLYKLFFIFCHDIARQVLAVMQVKGAKIQGPASQFHFLQGEIKEVPVISFENDLPLIL